ncbi:MAG: hypothetical protein ABSC94_08145 [Polyangiaceae bacterium]|jgi:hypothetical protein
MPRVPLSSDEEELEELPPLDGDSEEDDSLDTDLDRLDEEGADWADDSTGEGDPVDADEIEVDEGEGTWLDEASETPDLDLGELGLLELDAGHSSLDDGEDRGVEAEDFERDEPSDRMGLDAGDEGPVDPDDELRDEDLPALDADEERPEEADPWEPMLADGPVRLPWAPKPWVRVGAPLGIAQSTAIACVARGAIVAARDDEGRSELALVDLEGSICPLVAEGLGPVSVDALSVDGARIAVVAHGGRLRVARRADGAFESVAEGMAVADAVAVADLLWIRTTGGGLLVSGDAGRSWTRCPALGVTGAIVRDGMASMAALVIDDAGRSVALIRGAADGTISREPIDAPEAVIPTVLAARGGPVAYATRTGVARRGLDGVWRSFAWEGRVTALTFVDDVGTLVAAVYLEADDATSLLRIDAAGQTALVARIDAAQGAPDSDGQAVGLACDDSRGVIWIAGGFGVATFAMGII